MKKIFYITLMISLIGIVGCNSNKPNNGDGRNPTIDNSDFSDYVPWWATNNLSCTNGVTNNVNIQKK